MSKLRTGVCLVYVRTEREFDSVLVVVVVVVVLLDSRCGGGLGYVRSFSSFN